MLQVSVANERELKTLINALIKLNKKGTIDKLWQMEIR